MKHLLRSIFRRRHARHEEVDHSYSGHDGGAWDEEAHRKLYGQNFNEGMARFICNEISPSSYLEFGSGLGCLAKYVSQGTDAEPIHCIEPNEISGEYDQLRPKLFALDVFSEPMPNELSRKYDLVVSIEVAEHIEKRLHDQFFDILCAFAQNWVVFSAAHPGQGGHGHIAERPEAEWKSECLSRGLVFHPEMTKSIREACDSKNINHRRNLMVFRVQAESSV